MKIVNLNSGLGNQMFQFAFYLSLKDRFKNDQIKLDTSWYKEEKFHNGFELARIFNIDYDCSTSQEYMLLSRSGYNLLSRIKRRLLPKKNSELIESKLQQFHYSPNLYGKPGEDNYYHGYWQSYKYFESISETIKDCYAFPPLTEKKNIAIDSFIKSNKGKTVSIHVRRGDYLNNKSLGMVCSLDYYKNSILEMEKKIEDPFYLIFSNDAKWCKENFKLSNVEFIDWNTGDSSFRDMQLMSLCCNNIIANSSFSWWGAFLNSNIDKTVIAPKIWTKGCDAKDLIPGEWNRL